MELTAHGRIDEPRSGLGDYLVRHWERLALVNDESLVYWLRKLIFRGAWLDQRVKESLLEVDWDEETADFGYREPTAAARSSSSRPCRPGTTSSFGAERGRAGLRRPFRSSKQARPSARASSP